MLQISEASMNMITALENCIQFINYNGGFTTVRWYNRGVINDESIFAPQKSIMVTAVIILPTTLPMRGIYNLTQLKLVIIS